MEPSDRELLHRMAGGDRDALAPLMERHYRRLYRIIVSYLRNPDDALDGVQEAFVKAYCHAGQWDPATEPGPWLTRIAVNEAIDRYRRGKRRAASFTALESEPAQEAALDRPDRALGRREDAERIGAALEALSERHRTVFVLRHHEEMTLEEIGSVLGLPVGTVKSCLHRAVRQLRARLGGRS